MIAMNYKLTDEQTAIVDAGRTGNDITIEAGAGTGKTSTLKSLGDDQPRRRGVYLAYNKAIATDAARTFPSSVVCKTAHSFAYGAVGRTFSHRLSAPRMPARQAAVILGINEPVQLGEVKLAPEQLARWIGETLQRFCYSADEAIQRMHVPLINGLDKAGQRELAKYLMPIAQRAWDTDITQVDGRLRFTHDMYLKLWILSRPTLPADFVLLDEAQDSNPAVAGLVMDQPAQRILVGDRSQAIYGWRGATDAMATFGGERFQLSQSFRFGPAVADEANKWLELLDAPLRLTGFDQIPSRLAALPEPDAILCRSNAGAMTRAIEAIAQGRRAALVGGGNDIRRLAEAAQRLQWGSPTDHPELFAFASWAEVQDYVEHDAAGSDLKTFVRLIDRHGPAEVMRVCDALVDEKRADVVISTAHKAKGREWSKVRIANDFVEPKPDEDDKVRVARDEAMLAYVSVTRAQHVLDRSGLAWVDQLLRWEEPAEHEPPVPVAARHPAAAVMPDPPADPQPGEDLDADDYATCCRCGCTEDSPCLGGCQWASDEEQIAVGMEPMEGDLCDRCLSVPVVDPQPGDVDESFPIRFLEEPPAAPAVVTPWGPLTDNCYRCGHHHTTCTCTLMPDRRPLASVASRA